MKKQLFLKWCLATLITIVIISLCLLVARNHALSLSPVAQAMVGVIFLVYSVTTVYCATLCWQTDKALEDLERSDTLGDSDREQIKKYLRKLWHKADQVSFEPTNALISDC
jgi:hypothetical protein